MSLFRDGERITRRRDGFWVVWSMVSSPNSGFYQEYFYGRAKFRELLGRPFEPLNLGSFGSEALFSEFGFQHWEV